MSDLVDLPELPPPPGRWRLQGACNGLPVALFFPARGDKNAARQAKAACARCGVRDQCLDYALDNFIKHGIYGGTSEQERRRLRRQASA